MEQTQMACRGIRGAITVPSPSDADVRKAVRELLDAIGHANGCDTDDVAALIFTVPDDLPRINPAAAARDCGWTAVPLLMVREHGGDERVARCLRALVLWNTTKEQNEIQHVYLRGAGVRRPDLQPSEASK